jgi:hypothetical protein
VVAARAAVAKTSDNFSAIGAASSFLIMSCPFRYRRENSRR